MKKVFIILFTLFYFTAASGVTVHMHYCMDKLVDINLSHPDKDSCSMCAKKTKSQDCCKDKHEQLKVEKNQRAESLLKIAQLYAFTLPGAPIELPDFSIPARTIGHPLSHAPPSTSTVASYILHCTFRI